MKETEVIICGAGACGIICAILLAKAKIDVLVLEKENKIAKKLFASGNGKCNIGNRFISYKNYHSNSLEYLKEILKEYSFEDVIKLFRSLGIEITQKEDGKLYPSSFSAKSLIEVLEFELKRLKIKIKLNSRVKRVFKKEEKFIIHTLEEKFEAKYFILATGSEAMPKLGGSKDGLLLAKTLKHKITPTAPALVPLKSSAKWIKKVAGLKIDVNLRLLFNKKEITSKRGDLLFTKYGVSGLAVLDISKNISLLRDGKKTLVIDLFPDLNKNSLKELLIKRVLKSRKMPLEIWLSGLIHKDLALALIKEWNLLGKDESNLNQKMINFLSFQLKNIQIPILETRGFEWAEVALGGVELKDISPKTLESKRVKNLFFCGEVLDVCGQRGGFNLHFAWISSIKVAKSIIKLTHKS